MEYHPYPQCCPRSYCLSYPTVPCRIGGTSNGIPFVPQCYPRSHCPSYPTVPCRTGGTSVDQDPSPSYILMYSTAFESGYQYSSSSIWPCVQHYDSQSQNSLPTRSKEKERGATMPRRIGRVRRVNISLLDKTTGGNILPFISVYLRMLMVSRN